MPQSRLKILYAAFGVLLAILFFIVGVIPQADIKNYEIPLLCFFCPITGGLAILISKEKSKK